MNLKKLVLVFVAVSLGAPRPMSGAERGVLAFDSSANATFRFGGVLGERIDANVDNWLLRAPAANPGMLEMFYVRDRKPAPNLVPWAGEFVGKYLISAIQALRMSDDPRLEETAKAVVKKLIAAQAEDGYLGPFPKETRLLANWDLWGHYHCMEGLLMWNEQTGDEAALTACRRAADLVCKIYLDSGRRVLDAGSDEMNLAIIHALGMLYRKSPEERYLRMMREIEKDWERAGDYLRTGLAGREFYRIPRPRWESLHDLQGLVELYRITGDDKYKRAFLNHWQSIRRFDRRNTGGFSSGEQATGHPFAPTAIETCSTTAWVAITVDALRLTGDATAADELELSTYNSVAGSQHPSGRWWTYSTPMEGVREASAHAIVFQARAGTPELNCCAANGPRGLGMLSEWAVMQSPGRVAVNFLGPMTAKIKLDDGTALTLRQETDYPYSGTIKLKIELAAPKRFKITYRIPSWTDGAEIRAMGEDPAKIDHGYAAWNREWKSGDEIIVNFKMPLRYVSGDEEALGRISIYRGPLLLAYDQADNDFDEEGIPVLTPDALSQGRILPRSGTEKRAKSDVALPWLLVDLKDGNGQPLRLRDFASAGAAGTHYGTWFSAKHIAPQAPALLAPVDGSAVPPRNIQFTWRRMRASDSSPRWLKILVAESPDFAKAPLEFTVFANIRGLHLPLSTTSELQPNRDYYWKVVAGNGWGRTESLGPPKRFRIDPNLPPIPDAAFNAAITGRDAIVEADLHGNATPTTGKLVKEQAVPSTDGRVPSAAGALAFNGKNSIVIYAVESFPETDYSVSVWVSAKAQGAKLAEIFSAWCRGSDDPLRICLQDGKLFARIEAGRSFSTEGVAMEPEKWHHVVAMKNDTQLKLYLDGKLSGQVAVPAEIFSSSVDFALGGNPHFSGDEYFGGRIADFGFYGRALSQEEIEKLGKAPAEVSK